MKITKILLFIMLLLLGSIEFISTPIYSPLAQFEIISNAYADRDRRDADVDIKDVARRSSRRRDRRD